MKRRKPITIICETCGKEIKRHLCNIKKNMFCSSACYGKFSLKIKSPNTTCANCGKPIFKWPYEFIRSPSHFCNMKCRGEWQAKEWVGEEAKNWRGGSWNNRVQLLAHTSYRTWRAKLLKSAVCIICGSNNKLELHHIESRKDNNDRIKDESNVCPICSKCHDVFHSNSSKGRELRETLNAILAHGNPQPNRSNVVVFVGRKVQRLTDEDTQTNKSDTSAAPERDEIVWPISKDIEAVA